MKKIIFAISFTFVWLAFHPGAMAQANDPYVPIAIVVPRQAEPLDEAQAARLGNRMLEYTTRSGVSATSGGSPVAMLPNIAIEKDDVVETGMRNLTVLSADITFLIQNLETGVIYSSISKRVRGSGTNYQRALNDCISKISFQQDEFSQFVRNGRDKITDYYRANCSALLTRAETLAKTQQYEETFAVIASIPSTAGCYTQALAMLERYYPSYQHYNCQDLLNKANTLWSGHHYQRALTILYDLKVFGTDCNAEVNALATAIESRLTDNEMREWRLLEEKLRTKAFLEEKRLETIMEIGVAYYGRTVFHNYTYLVPQSAYPLSGTTINQNIVK